MATPHSPLRLALLLSTFLLGLASMGCNESLGEHGNVGFSFLGGWSCVGRCSIERAIAEGTGQSLVVNSVRPVDGLSAEVSVPGVLSIEAEELTCFCRRPEQETERIDCEFGPASCRADRGTPHASLRLDAKAMQAGDVKLQVYDKSGELFDELGFQVRRVHRISLRTRVRNDDGASTVDLHHGDSIELGMHESLSVVPEVYDQFDKPLQISSGLEFEWDDPVGVVVSDVELSHWLRIEPQQLGQARLVARMGLARAQIDFKVRAE